MLRNWLIALGCLVWLSWANAQGVQGCPAFHCNKEATGVIPASIIASPTAVTVNNSVGSMSGQGCSGDVNGLFCLVTREALGSSGPKGTLKSVDPTSMMMLWGSASAANSYDLAMDTASVGQVPYILANGYVAAGDSTGHVLYNRDGGMIGRAVLAGSGNNFGMTPLSDRYAAVSQKDGVITLVDTSTWQSVSSLVLKDPSNSGPVALVSPSSASGNVLYAVTSSSLRNRGILFAVVLDEATKTLSVRSTFVFTGASGASPVVVKTEVSGKSWPMVLLHTPGLPGDATAVDRLMALTDNGRRFSTTWSVTLPSGLPVSPTIDAARKGVLYVLRNGTKITRLDLGTGALQDELNIQSISGFSGTSGTFKLNGHMAAAASGQAFNLLISAEIAGSTTGENGQYTMVVDGVGKSLLWLRKTSDVADSYTAAWNVVRSGSTETSLCPVVVGAKTGLTKICN